jgi:hypothetical protein
MGEQSATGRGPDRITAHTQPSMRGQSTKRRLASAVISFMCLAYPAGCATSQPRAQAAPPAGMPSELAATEWNTYLSLTPSTEFPAPDELATTQFLALTNLTDFDVCFPYDYGLMTYLLDSSGTVSKRLPQLATFMIEKDVVLQGRSKPPFHGHDIVPLWVDTVEDCSPCMVRVVVQGKVANCDSGKAVGAFLDVTMHRPDGSSATATSTSEPSPMPEQLQARRQEGWPVHPSSLLDSRWPRFPLSMAWGSIDLPPKSWSIP